MVGPPRPRSYFECSCYHGLVQFPKAKRNSFPKETLSASKSARERGTEYETICLPNEMVGGSEDYLGRQWTLMLFHLEIIRERERHSGPLRLGLARQYPRGIIIRVECACVPIPLGLTRTVNSVLIRGASLLLAQHIASDHRQHASCPVFPREREG